MRTCKLCGQEKELELFRKRLTWRSHVCKACHAAKYATGKPNTGRFQKGHKTWCEGKKGKIEKKLVPRYIKKGRPEPSEKKQGKKGTIWSLSVKTRDNFTCQDCGEQNNVQAHHIIPWNECKEKRFELDNGITLCSACHMKAERLYDLAKGKNSFSKYYESRMKPIKD